MIWATINDSDALGAIEERNIIDYMERHGWVLLPHPRAAYGYLYEHPVLKDQVVFAKRECTDYVRRLSQLLTSLSEIENRSQLDIYLEMGGKL